MASKEDMMGSEEINGEGTTALVMFTSEDDGVEWDSEGEEWNPVRP